MAKYRISFEAKAGVPYEDAAAAIETFENGEADVIEDYGDGCDFGFGLKNIRDTLNTLPTADVAQVVRCKDCMYFDADCCKRNFPSQDVSENDFCSNGELRKPKAMISQPMRGKTDQEIETVREKAIAALNAKGYEIVNTWSPSGWEIQRRRPKRDVEQVPLNFLARSLEKMSLCHAVYFCHGWETARGCRIEHDAACAYDLTIIYEDGYNVMDKKVSDARAE